MAASRQLSSLASCRQQILARFPGQFSFCFAYGSGVKQQLGYADINSSSSSGGSTKDKAPALGPSSAPLRSARPMIDLILCVDDPADFHRRNMFANRADYSQLARLLGAGAASRLQQTRLLGAGVYCNTLVPLEATTSAAGAPSPTMIKYGVVSTRDLLRDLRDWRHLYVAGRLHKPVDVLLEPATSALRDAVHSNLEQALRVALLRLPEQFTGYQLFYAVANLSYAGDFRMRFGEKRDKVANIVAPQVAEFERLYAEVLARLERHDVLVALDNWEKGQHPGGEPRRFVQNKGGAMTLQHLLRLPAALKEALGGGAVGGDDAEQQLRRLIREQPVELERRLSLATEQIVWQSSVGQSLKNIPTAGVGKAVRYSWQKVLKTFNL